MPHLPRPTRANSPYPEYWAGSLEIHSLEGFGVDAFLQISKLGNKNERYVLAALEVNRSMDMPLTAPQPYHSCHHGRHIAREPA